MKRVNENGVHVDFDQDISRNAVKVVDDLPMEDVEKTQRLPVFMSKLETLGVPKAFNPFVTTYLMQGGYIAAIAQNILTNTEDSVIPNLPSVQNLMSNNLMPLTPVPYTVVKVDNGILHISSDVTFWGSFQKKDFLPDNLEN